MISGCGDDAPAPDLTWRDAFDATDTGWLLSTWGSADDDRYAVGGTLDEGVIWHHAGGRWRQIDDLPAETPLLNWVFGFSDEDVWVVGNGGSVLHYDGSRWRRQSTPTEEDLWGIWGAGSDELWAVGGSGRPDAEATLLRYDGDAWELVELPEFERAGVHALFKIWGASKDEIFAVGQNGIVLQYDGDEWQEQLVGASDDLIGVWGTGPNDVLAVGGRGGGVISHYDGKEWTTTTLFRVPGINGVWMQTPGVAHLAVTEGRIAILDVEAPEEIELIQPGTSLDFHAIYGTEGKLTAVGGNFDTISADDLRGVALERDLGSND